MTVLPILFIVIQIFVAFFFIYPSILYLLSIFKNSNGDVPETIDEVEVDYAIIVTAYEQTTLIPSVVDSIMRLNYSNYLVYVVADNCDTSNLVFQSEKVVVIRPAVVLKNNVKSHFCAINNFRRQHERLTIIDSDNLVDSEYLNELNKLFNNGYSAVQGVRQAKNLNTEFACLDEAGDIFYRYTDRKLLFNAGSSSSLAGSGMAFTTRLYRECLAELTIDGAGFDKILQYEILKRGLKIAFAERAIVYDEKTAKSSQLVKQRARWINTWFKFFILGIRLNALGIMKFDSNRFLFSLMLIRPPLFIMILLATVFLIANIFFLSTLSLIWLAIVLCFLHIIFKSLLYFRASKEIYNSLKSVPVFIFYQILALLKIRKANDISVATRHEYKSNISDLK